MTPFDWNQPQVKEFFDYLRLKSMVFTPASQIRWLKRLRSVSQPLLILWSPGRKDVRDFISYLRLKNLSQRTIANYQTELNNFFRFCPLSVDNPHEVTFEHLRDYIAGLQARGLAAKTTPHTLRHSIAVHYLQGGAPVNFVQSLLGHASLATTGRYLQLTDQMAKKIALDTETAFEGSAFSQKELKVREPYPSYH
jgi:integrase